MGLLATDLANNKKPIPWSRALMQNIWELAQDDEQYDRLIERVFTPYEHGYCAVFLDEMSEDELRHFKRLLQSFMVWGGNRYLNYENSINDAIDVISEVIKIKCPH